MYSADPASSAPRSIALQMCFYWATLVSDVDVAKAHLAPFMSTDIRFYPVIPHPHHNFSQLTKTLSISACMHSFTSSSLIIFIHLPSFIEWSSWIFRTRIKANDWQQPSACWAAHNFSPALDILFIVLICVHVLMRVFACICGQTQKWLPLCTSVTHILQQHCWATTLVI